MREFKLRANYIVHENSSYIFTTFLENLVLKFSMKPWQCTIKRTKTLQNKTTKTLQNNLLNIYLRRFIHS